MGESGGRRERGGGGEKEGRERKKMGGGVGMEAWRVTNFVQGRQALLSIDLFHSLHFAQSSVARLPQCHLQPVDVVFLSGRHHLCRNLLSGNYTTCCLQFVMSGRSAEVTPLLLHTLFPTV